MGLDMYAYTTKDKVTQEVDFDVKKCDPLHYWCKHPNLHGMMHVLYMWKGGKNPDFNCSNLALTPYDLTTLENAVLQNTLPETAGFFFGTSDGSEQSDDIEFIAKARKALRGGLKVFYRAWW